MYEDFKDNIGYIDYFKSEILLAATNEISDRVNNDEMVEQIPEDGEVYTLQVLILWEILIAQPCSLMNF